MVSNYAPFFFNLCLYRCVVVEAERPVKQQKKLELLTRELDLMSVSKDLKMEFNKVHGIPNNEETLKWSSPVRDGNMKKYFRLLTSLDGQDSLSSESIEDLLKKQFDGVFDSPSKLDSVDRKRSLESRDESPSKMRSNVKLSKLDEWGTEEVMYKIVDLVEEEYDDEESTPSYSEVTLPVVRSSKEVIKEKVNDCYVDYYYMDEEETVSYRPSKSVKVPIEYFREELLNEEYVYENEYDTETEDYESDDSQNVCPIKRITFPRILTFHREIGDNMKTDIAHPPRDRQNPTTISTMTMTMMTNTITIYKSVGPSISNLMGCLPLKRTAYENIYEFCVTRILNSTPESTQDTLNLQPCPIQPCTILTNKFPYIYTKIVDSFYSFTK